MLFLRSALPLGFQDDVLVEITINGKTLKGYVLEPSEGTAIGTITLSNTAAIKAVQKTHLGRSDNDFRPHQTEDAYNAAAGRLHISAAALRES